MTHKRTISEAITIKEAALYFGVSVRTIRNWMEKDDGFPQGFKRFGTLRFRKSEIEAYWVENAKRNAKE
jgi:predicted DNA-binding transcriptional regulator AlpA